MFTGKVITLPTPFHKRVSSETTAAANVTGVAKEVATLKKLTQTVRRSVKDPGARHNRIRHNSELFQTVLSRLCDFGKGAFRALYSSSFLIALNLLTFLRD